MAHIPGMIGLHVLDVRGTSVTGGAGERLEYLKAKLRVKRDSTLR